MTRRLPILVPILVLALGIVLAASAHASNESAAPLSVSRDQVTVTDAVVRVGDLFSNTGSKAGIVVESAPEPGGRAVYDVHRLAAIARAHGLTWQARSWSERVVIERAAQIIGAERIMMALRDAITRETQGSGPTEIEVVQRSLSLTLPVGKPATVKIESLRHNAATGQFTAVIAAPADDPDAVRLNVAGRVHRVIEVPTLNRRMMPGDVIGRNDISWISMRADQVSRNVITDAGRLIGATPSRPAIPARMLNNGDVRPPTVVAKGTTVTMLLRTSNMVLTSKGRAMEDGARGDVIRVMNIQTKTAIEGEVTSSGTVMVTAAHFLPIRSDNPQTAGIDPARRQ